MVFTLNEITTSRIDKDKSNGKMLNVSCHAFGVGHIAKFHAIFYHYQILYYIVEWMRY